MVSSPFGGNSNYNLREAVWLIRQEVANNRSLLGWQLWIDKTAGSGYRSSNAPSDRQFYLDGAMVGANTGGGFNLQSSSSILILSGENWVTHAADGKKTVSIRGNAQYDILGNAQVTASLALPTIPRASTATFTGGAAFDAGTAVTINTNRASSGFTHDITWTFGGQSGTVGTGVGTSILWTPALSMLTQIPNGASGTGTLSVVTKSGSTVIGTKNTSFTLRAPASIVPTINAPTLVDDNATVKSIVGAYVQGLSRLKATVTGAGIQGSTITSTQFSIGTRTADSGDTLELPTSGATSIVSKVTDSRSRSASRTDSITVLAYNPPKITKMVVDRYNPALPSSTEGSSLRVTLTAEASSLMNGTQKNSLGIRVYTRVRGTVPWVTRNVINHTAMTYNSNFVISGGNIFPPSQAFDVRVEIFDKFNTSAAQVVVTTANVYMHWAPNGTGFGKYHERGSIDAAGDIYTRGSLVEPVGIILEYAGSTAPYGWMLAQGQAISRTEYAALFAVLGTTYGAGDGSTTFNLPDKRGKVGVGLNSSEAEFNALGKAGGAKTHTLTVAEMPSHTHNMVRSTTPGSGSTRFLTGNAPTSSTTSLDVNPAGGDQPHNNMPPYMTFNYIIKVL